ncbi:MAG: NAD-dependent epimerase/dehydratase family protein [Candidatus Bathyarchaeota archaeon]
MNWTSSNVLITGGASFIGSHLVNSLLKKGATLRVADDFSSGRLSNLEYDLKRKSTGNWSSKNLSVYKGDLKNPHFARKMIKDMDVIFHLAALHGGRGYIDTHPAQCCTNMILDQTVLEQAQREDVNRICFASSACVYPTFLQRETGSAYLLKEEDADPFIRDKAFPDLEYGWAKFMGEMAMRAYHKQYGMKTSCVRIFTAYGPRENETHAVVALIAKAFIQMDPYIIWGSGKQERNFTFVDDIVDVMALASERIEDGSPVNSGRCDRITLDRTAEIIFKLMNWKPRIMEHDSSKPTGVESRAADLTRARELLGWQPKITFEQGIEKTINWYVKNKRREEVKTKLDQILMER